MTPGRGRVSAEILGGPETAEFRNAERFANRLIDLLAPVAGGSEVRVVAVPSLQCHGSRIQDIDLLVMVQAAPALRLAHGGGTLELDSAVFTVECKAHSGDAVRLQDEHAYVRYDQPAPRWENATAKAEEQARSARRFLGDLTGKDFFTVSLVHLANVHESQIPAAMPGVLGGEFGLARFLASLARSRAARYTSGIDCRIAQREDVGAAAELLRRFRRPVVLSALNRKRVERITERYARDQQFYQAVGNKLVLFRGKAGTGKTSFLIRLACDLARQGRRCLFLTFNHALRVELLTLLASQEAAERLRLRGAPAPPRIETDGLNSFLHDAFVAAGLLPTRSVPRPYEANYLRLLRELAALPPQRLARAAEAEGLRFDFVLVDEGQDIHEEERAALVALFGRNRIIASIGHDQLVREAACDWTRGLGEGDFHIKRNNRSLRMKQGIVGFVDRIAAKLAIADYEPYEGAEMPGGRVIVHPGKYSPELHAAVKARALSDDSGCSAGDILMAITERHRKDRNLPGRLCDFLRKQGDTPWNGADGEVRRRNVPLRPDEIRVCNYMSVRGLECWAMVCHWLDHFFEEQLRADKAPPSDIFGAQSRAFGKVAIACTRPIDTLVITLESDRGAFSQACLEAAKEDPEHCELR